MKIPSSSRIGKRQIIAFLDTGQIDAAYKYAIDNGKTNQEVIASAINIVLKKTYGNTINILPEGHERINRRFHGRAKIRMGVTPIRNQTKSFSGWYSKELVEQVSTIARNNGTNIQNLIAKGIEMLTNVQAYANVLMEREEWSDGVVWD